jgi:hypothetical protein
VPVEANLGTIVGIRSKTESRHGHLWAAASAFVWNWP